MTAATVAQRYADFLDGYVVEDCDAEGSRRPDLAVRATKTLMQSLEDRRALAAAVLGLADELASP